MNLLKSWELGSDEMDTEIQKILIIGGGPTEIGHETELDAACVQIIQAFKKQGIRSLLIDNNPFSAALEDVSQLICSFKR